MNDHEKIEALAEKFRKEMTDGTQPRVISVAIHQNPMAPLFSNEELLLVRTKYEGLSCMQTVALIDFLIKDQNKQGVALSYALTLMPSDIKEPSEEKVPGFFMQSGIVLGTRTCMGHEGAAVWFQKSSEDIGKIDPIFFQYFDVHFGQALKILQSVDSHRVVINPDSILARMRAHRN